MSACRVNLSGPTECRLVAANAKSRNGRDDFAIARDGLYSGLPVTRRPLPDLLPTRRRSAVTDNISAVATPNGRPGRGKANTRHSDQSATSVCTAQLHVTTAVGVLGPNIPVAPETTEQYAAAGWFAGTTTLYDSPTIALTTMEFDVPTTNPPYGPQVLFAPTSTQTWTFVTWVCVPVTLTATVNVPARLTVT